MRLDFAAPAVKEKIKSCKPIMGVGTTSRNKYGIPSGEILL